MHWEAAQISPVHDLSVMPHTKEFVSISRQAGLDAFDKTPVLWTAAFGHYCGLKYIFSRCGMIGHTSVCKYVHCSGKHAILIRAAQTLTVNVHVEHSSVDETASVQLRDADGTTWSEKVSTDKDVKLSDVLPSLKTKLNFGGKLSYQGKLICMHNGRKISGRKVLAKKLKAICMHGVRLCGYDRARIE